MAPATALDYLTMTSIEFWDFKECVNLAKKERNCNTSTAYSYLNNLLKSKFNNYKSKSWIENWSNLVREYEKAKQSESQAPNNKPKVFLRAHKQTNYIATNQMVNQVPTQPETQQQQQNEQAATSRKQQQQQEPISKNKGKKAAIFTEEDEEEEEDDEKKAGIDVYTDFRSLVFKAGYDFFKYGAVSMETVRTLNLKLPNHQPKTLAEALDVLSYELLLKEKNIAQTHALKLSLSHIIYFHGTTLEVFDDFFESQSSDIKVLYEKAKMTVPALPDGMNEKINGVFNDIVTCQNDGVDEMRASVCKKKADLLVVKEHDKELVKMLDILDYLIMNFGVVSSKESEVTCYRKAAHIMDILFRNTPLNLIDGEHSSDATKDARNANKKAVDDDNEKKDLIGRKIDLIIKGSEVEVSSSEWKKSKTTANVIQQQRIKNIRTNSAMLHNLSELADHDNLFILGMDWVGYVGLMICLSQVSDVHCAHIVGDLVLPLSINVLDMFKNTLNLLYMLKQLSLSLLEIITPALEKRAIKEQFKLMDSSYNEPTVRPTPLTFFTPKKKRERKN